MVAQQQLTNEIPLEEEMAVAIATLALHSLKNVSSGGDLLALQSAMDCCALVREGGREGVRGGGDTNTIHITYCKPTPYTSLHDLMPCPHVSFHPHTSHFHPVS